MTTKNEQRYFDALKRITRYMTVAQLRRRAGGDYGLEQSEALEYAYENVIEEARAAIRGRRRPSGDRADTADSPRNGVPANAAGDAPMEVEGKP